jgi:hypothetical protein
MSSTSNAQDLLVNVFRPTYRWDSNTGFVPSLVVSNVSEIITGSLKTDALVVSDTGNNTYIGSNAGLRAINTSYNVGLGYQAMGGAINSSNNVAVGYYALDGVNNSTSNVVLGAYSGIVSSNGGTRNVLVGPNVTLASGTGNILIGTDISLASASNRLQLGKLIYGDLRSGFIGVNLTDPSGAFDVSGTTFFRGKVGIQTTEESPKYSLDVNGSVYANNRFFGGLGSFLEPLYSFDAASNTGMYVPAAIAGYGNGAFAIAVNQKPAAIFSDTCVNFFQNLDVSGTFSACNVQISAFAVEPGTRADPTITFASNRSDGFYHLAGMDGFSAVTLGQDRMMFLGTGDISSARILGSDISLSGAIFTNSGCNVVGGVTLSNGNVILTGTATNSNLLVPGWIRDNETAPVVDISDGTVQAIKFRAQNGSAPIPAYSFSSDPSSGMHLVRTSAIGFDTAGIQRMCISGGFVGIGTSAPRVALDVSGDISANVYNGPGGTALAPHYTFSDDRTTGFFFPGANIIGMTAGGRERMRISNGFVAIGTTVDPSSTLDVSGVFRIIGANGNITFNNGTIDVSGTPLVSTTGAFSNATTTSNVIGGVTLSNRDLSMTDTGRILGMLGVSNVIGGTTFSNFDISLASGGRILGMPNTSNRIGGVTLDSTNITYAGRISNTLDTTSNRIGGVTLNAGSITYATTITGTTDNTTNKIGGVTLSNGSITAGNPALINTIGSVYISNYTITTADATGLNSIGGVTLSSSNITYAGRISNTVDNTSNRIGGVILDSTNISYAGRISNTVDNTSNRIGGVILSNSNVFTGNGSATIPTYSFTNDPSTGLHLAGGSQLVFDTSGVRRMCISGGNVGIGSTITAPFSALDLSDGTLSFRRRAGFSGLSSNNTASIEIGGGYNNAGGGQVNGAFPGIAFAYWEGGYRHFIRSRHSGGVARNSGVDFLINTGIGDASSTTIGVNNSNMLSVTAAGVGVGRDLPLGALDVSGSIRVGCLTGNELNTNAGSIEIGGGINGSNVGGLPAIAFQGRDGATPNGFGWRHFIQTIHSGGIATTGNAIRFFICSGHSNGSDVSLSSAPGVGNKPVMSVTQQGVGIGTTAPAAWLDISAGNATGLRIGGLSGTSASLFDVTGDRGYATVTTNGFFSIFKAGTTDKANSNKLAQFAGDTGGVNYFLSNEVGIGTSNPANLLSVVAPSSIGYANRASRFVTNYQVSIADGGGTAPGLYLGAYYTGAAGAASSIQSSDSWDGSINPAPLLLNPVGGAVGINHPTPEQTLDVIGTARATTFIGNGIIPINGIIMWWGTIASIPTGWRLCDGTNGTPDLRDRFVLGAGNSYTAQTTGGSVTIAVSNIPAHTHGFTFPSVGYSATFNSSQEALSVGGRNNGDQARTFSSTGGGSNYLQPYYALAFIMRTA